MITEQMKSYIPHRILVINDHVFQNALDETLLKCYTQAFDWANRMGQEGKRVFDLFLEKPEYDMGPLSSQYCLWCKIECTTEERKKWEEETKANVW